MHILGGHGVHLEGLFLHTPGWVHASDLLGGTTGINPRMREAPAFMNTGKKSLLWLTLHASNLSKMRALCIVIYSIFLHRRLHIGAFADAARYFPLLLLFLFLFLFLLSPSSQGRTTARRPNAATRCADGAGRLLHALITCDSTMTTQLHDDIMIRLHRHRGNSSCNHASPRGESP
ncbi:hypothetical protein KSP40_PGU013416 [Platanthera guangdongensis]|uniref:Uncharacterized protein n=1 Tax=Platanthera guangdongensis TaxID=2320717 RepID=A0ABR2MCY7_9ASPA